MTKEIEDAPCFPPHVTLLPDIPRSEYEVLTAAKHLAATLEPFQVDFERVASGHAFFQCVYLLVAREPKILDAWRAACEACGLPARPGEYMPHLSLVYADIPEDQRRKMASTIHGKLFAGPGGVRDGFVADTIAVMRTPADDRTLSSWKMVGEVRLVDRSKEGCGEGA